MALPGRGLKRRHQDHHLTQGAMIHFASDEAHRTPWRPIGASGPPPILIVPGLFNSAPDHWQSHWERILPEAERVEQSDWERPTLGEWTAGLAEAVRRRPGAVLVAHSLGCALVAHLTRISQGRGIGGALLVAPADVNRNTTAGQLLKGFSPVPLQRLPFASTVVASHDDPYVSIDRAEVFARAWGSNFVDLGRAGHINVESGHGPWPEGRAILNALISRIPAAQTAPERWARTS